MLWPLVPLILVAISAENVAATFLKSTNFNRQPYDIRVSSGRLLDTIYRKLKAAEPTRQGPVLFPNDAPPPPRPPLIVTSRPLIDSISRSELANRTPNNSIVDQVQNFAPINFYKNVAYDTENEVDYTQNYAPEKYIPDSYIPDKYTPDIYIGDKYDQHTYNPDKYNSDKYTDDIYNTDLDKIYEPNLYKYRTATYKNANSGLDVTDHGYNPYDNLFKKLQFQRGDAQGYNKYKDRTSAPPIYKVLSDYAGKKLKAARTSPAHAANAREQNEIKSGADYDEYNEVEDSTNYGKKYAFSYSVKGHDTGDDFSHKQQSSGTATNGEYRVRLPDGRVQIVSYTADESGYKADVRYDDRSDNSIDNVDFGAYDSGSATQNNAIGAYSNDIGTYNRFSKHNNGFRNHENGIRKAAIDTRNNIGLYKSGITYAVTGIPVNRSPKPLDEADNDYGQYDSREIDSGHEYGNKVLQDHDVRPSFQPIVVANPERPNLTSPTVSSTIGYDGTVLITPTKKSYFRQPTTATPLEISAPSTSVHNVQPTTDSEGVVRIGNSKPLYTSIASTYTPLTFSSTIAAQQYVSGAISPAPTFVSSLSKYLSYH